MNTAAASVRLVPSSSLHISRPVWWLESRFHFSFADYYNPQRSSWGALRVLNDDLVKPRSGFGRHPHRDAEIFSYVVDGQLSHEDSMGNREALSRGAVQYMSAGSGVTHSEMNDSGETCRFLQVWLTPDRRGHQPQYGSTTFERGNRHNRLLHILGGTGSVPKWTPKEGSGVSAIQLHQDANVFVAEMDDGVAFDLELAPQRQAYIVAIEGSLAVNEQKLQMRDAAEVEGAANAPTALRLAAGGAGAHVMVIEMKKAA